MNCAVIVYVRKEVLRNNVLSKFKAGQMILSRSVGVGGGEVEIDESLINLRQRQLFEIEAISTFRKSWGYQISQFEASSLTTNGIILSHCTSSL